MSRYRTACPVCLGDLEDNADTGWATCAMCRRSFETSELPLSLIEMGTVRSPSRVKHVSGLAPRCAEVDLWRSDPSGNVPSADSGAL